MKSQMNISPASDITYEHLSLVASRLIEACRVEMSNLMPSEFAEKYLTLSKAVSPNAYGRFSYEYTPYWREVVDFFSLSNPHHTGAVMKPSQIGGTQAVLLPALIWIIGQQGGTAMFLSGDMGLARKFVNERLEQAINSAGLRHLIKVQESRNNKQRSGDTELEKQFPNGQLNVLGAQNLENDMVFDTVQFLLADEVDRWKSVYKRGGDAFSLTSSRGLALGDRRRYMYISTPELVGSSVIEKVYNMGDGRKWHVRCSMCGEEIALAVRPIDDEGRAIRVGKKQAGLTFETEGEMVVKNSVRYCCQVCGDYFDENAKFGLVQNGRWKATQKKKNSGHISWHLNRLYAPKGQSGWVDICQQYGEAKPLGGTVIVPKYKTFRQTIEGLPFEVRKESVNVSSLQKNIRNYDIGEVPEILSEKDGNGKIVLLTFACDLNGTLDDARVDWEILAYSRSGSTYSVEVGSIGTFVPYHLKKKFNEKEKNHYEKERQKWTYELFDDFCVWNKIKEIASKTYITDTGRDVQPILACIDVGFGHSDSQTGEQRATTFILEQDMNTLPVFVGFKGEGYQGQFSVNSPYIKRDSKYSRHYLIDSNSLKFELQSKLSLKWDPQKMTRQPAGYCNFPRPADGKYSHEGYFKHFSAEHPVVAKDGRSQEWKKIDKRENHFWDVRYYGLALQKFIIQDWWESSHGGGKSPKSLGIDNSWDAFCRSTMPD